MINYVISRMKSYLKSNDRQRSKIAGAICVGDNVEVGRNASFGGEVVLYATARITIGVHTMIGMRTIIHTSTHDYKEHPMWRKRIDRPVEIGSHVWIGTAVVIMPGVRVGDYAVVGAGSVVTEHVPVGAIVAGNPARIIKHRNLTNLISHHPVVPDYPEGSIIVEESFLPPEKQCKEREST